MGTGASNSSSNSSNLYVATVSDPAGSATLGQGPPVFVHAPAAPPTHELESDPRAGEIVIRPSRRGVLLAVTLMVSAGCATSGTARGLVAIGSGLPGPSGPKATVYATGLAKAADFALDGSGRLWVAPADSIDHGNDGVFMVTGAGAAPVPVIAGVHTPPSACSGTAVPRTWRRRAGSRPTRASTGRISRSTARSSPFPSQRARATSWPSDRMGASAGATVNR